MPETRDTQGLADLEVAVIGDFQIGKSTFVNCLVGRIVAETGRGISTTHEVASYPIFRGISIVDTPGFGAPNHEGREDERMAREAIQRAFVVIVYLKEPMGEVCKTIVKDIVSHGKRCVFVYNCCNDQRWAPDENDDICRQIESEIQNLGYSDMVVKLGGRCVNAVNAKWALFGLGIVNDAKSIKKIRSYAFDQLELPENIDLRAEMIRRSNLREIQRYIQGLPLEVISDYLANRDGEIKRMIDRFLEKLTERLELKA